MSQTAVDYLFEKLWQMPKDKFVWKHYLDKTKQMEKDQIQDAYWDGIFYREFLDGQEYYNETYGKK